MLTVERLETRDAPTVTVSITQIAPYGDPRTGLYRGGVIIDVQGDAAPDVIVVLSLPHNRLLVNHQIIDLNKYQPDVNVNIDGGPGRDLIIVGPGSFHLDVVYDPADRVIIR